MNKRGQVLMDGYGQDTQTEKPNLFKRIFQAIFIFVLFFLLYPVLMQVFTIFQGSVCSDALTCLAMKILFFSFVLGGLYFLVKLVWRGF